VCRLGTVVFDQRIGRWAAALFDCTPLVSWLSTTAYVDNAVALFVISPDRCTRSGRIPRRLGRRGVRRPGRDRLSAAEPGELTRPFFYTFVIRGRAARIMAAQHQRVICILGMHRSGTSLVARLVNLLGVDLGSDPGLAARAEDNPRGFWEHPGFVAINEALLAQLGGRWDAPPRIATGWEHDASLARLRDSARELIDSFGSATLWGWKDPRTCLTLPFWQALLPALEYVVCTRHLLEVAQSLRRRNGFDLVRSGRIWLASTASVLADTADHRRLVVPYGRVLSGGPAEVRRMHAFLSGGDLDPAVERQCLEAIDRSLRHHHAIEAAGRQGLPPILGAAQTIVETLEQEDTPVLARAAARALANLRDADEDAERGAEEMTALEDRVKAAESEAAELRRVRQQQDEVNYALSAQIDTIMNSKGWRWLMRYRRAKERYRRVVGGNPAPQRAARAGTPPARVEPPAGSWGALPLLPASDPAAAALVLQQASAERGIWRPDVICLPVFDWEFRYQRPQQIVSQFAAHGYRVFYVSASRFVAPGEEPAVRLIKDHVYEVQVAAERPPRLYADAMDRAVILPMLESLGRLRRSYDITSALCLITLPSWAELAFGMRDRWGWPIVYDCMDEWGSFDNVGPGLPAAEAALGRTADVLIVSAARLRDRWRAAGRDVVLARNAVDYGFFASRVQPNDLLAGTPHPIIGYFGAIAEWFDVDLVAAVARDRPDYQFVLIGHVSVDVRALNALPNVTLLGERPHSAIPHFLHHFDVCLIPFRITPLTQATDPVKLYEYLSGGKPVVSVPLPELDSCREQVFVAADGRSFAAAIDRALVEHTPERADERRAFAARNSWSARFEAIEDGLVRATPPVSIVIVTFGNLPLTELCLESVRRNTRHLNVEIVVVDNASPDGTPAFLEAFAERHPGVRVILNPENRGFAAANNQGLAASTGASLVLLNNDTVVPPGWLTGLLAHLEDPSVGLVGPVTNFAGNEAKIEVPYRTMREMELFAADRAVRYARQRADIPMVAMFCTAMRREVWTRIGPLDERFGIGMFEDDDYTRRVRAAGLAVVCARDVFVHHVGKATFKALIDTGEYQALFERNRRAYEDKWGAWQAHRHADLEWTAR
jgi:GT2 family glycosyltransferase/glycosyltransferase involved in cell wall biosynthesis